VRLADIDAPERRQQPYGTRSGQSLAELCHRKQASVHAREKDRYGRTVGYVICDGTDANAEQDAPRDRLGLRSLRKAQFAAVSSADRSPNC
jgi:endonuclease YncB( thermonuclease family)